jgi:hypothetical protein
VRRTFRVSLLELRIEWALVENSSEKFGGVDTLSFVA